MDEEKQKAEKIAAAKKKVLLFSLVGSPGRRLLMIWNCFS
jgi:hypothetical protein